MLGADIATLWDNSAYNAGFVVVRPTLYGLRVYELVRKKTRASKRLDDQSALNAAIRDLKLKHGLKGFVAAALDGQRYMCGLKYFESSEQRLPPLPPPSSTSSSDDPLRQVCSNDASCPVVVHNNFIVSREAKIYRFKEHLMWMYDKGRLSAIL